jgi:hypothetical protein
MLTTGMFQKVNGLFIHLRAEESGTGKGRATP